MAGFLSRARSVGLRARLLGIVLLAVVPLAGLLFAYAGTQNAAAADRARAEVQRGLQTDASAVRDLVQESRETLVTFGITYAIQFRDWKLVQGNAVRLKALHPEYAVVAVADQTGRILASSTGQTGTVNVADRAFFERATATRSLVVTGYGIDPVAARPTIAVAYPAYDAAGHLIGVEYIGFEPSAFASRLPSSPPAFSVEAMIDASGTVVATRPDLPGVTGRTRADSPLVRTALSATDGGTAVVAGLDGVVRQYYFTRVFPDGSGGLRLAIGFSAGELLAAQSRSFDLTLLGFGGVALLALASAWLLGTFAVYRPIRQLGVVATRLARGDLSARSGVMTGAGEIDDLGRRFDGMAEAIEGQVQELERAHQAQRELNEQLEERVRRRTAELSTSNTELEAFNYSVSHDLRAPLRAIAGFSQALLEDYSDKLDEEGQRNLERVKAAANRMGELIDSLLALSRLMRVEMDVRDVDLTRMADEVVADLRTHDPSRDAAIDVQRGMVGKADPTLVRTVLENLLGNAWKFTGETSDARIEVGAELVGEETVYHVKDNGAGFDMAYADKLFGAFQRLHDQSEFPGTGVGLATVARVVHRHGGRVWAEGRPGEGATFYFTLR